MKKQSSNIGLVLIALTFLVACDDSSLPMTVGGATAPIIRDRVVCGDGVRAEVEQCDDGNLNDGDGCSQFCLIEGVTSGGVPVGGVPVGGAPVGGASVGGEPAGGVAVGGQPSGGEPSGGEPSGGEPSGGEPSGGEPSGGEPSGGEPSGGEPSGGEPVGGAMVMGCVDDSYEDNDEVTSAAPLNPRSITAPLSLMICQGDDDFFVIQGCAGAALQVTLTQALEESDLDLRLTAQDGRQFAASATPNSVESLRYVFSADHPAYLKVYGFQGSEGAYELSVSLTECVVTSQCLSDQDCDQGERCEGGGCVALPPPECVQSSDCLPDERCVNGSCELAPPPPECVLDADCALGERCVNGSCELAPPPPPECLDDLDCSFGERCESGSCEALPPGWCESDFDCSFFEYCVNNTCSLPPPECVQHSDCALDEVCAGGVCFYEPAECVSGSDCYNNELCINERCVAIEHVSASCVFDSDCGPLSTCEEGSCVAPELSISCLADTDCGLYQLCSDGSCVYERDRIEDDDSLAGAEPLTSNLYSHLTIEGGDDDWISVEVCEGGSLDAEIRFTDSLGDLDLKLYDATEYNLASSTSVTDHERVLYLSPVAQLLYLKVYGWNGASNSYDLSIRVSGCGGFEQDELEDNDRPSTAALLTPGLYSALTVTERDSDWYAADVCAGGTLSVNLTFSDAAGDIDMRLYNKLAAPLVSSTSVDDNEALSYSPTSDERLYWKVYGISGAENSYEMDVRISGCDGVGYLEEDRIEDNNQYSGAELLSPNLYGDLTISGRHDDDWVTFEVCAGGVGEVEIAFDELESDLELELYDEALNLIASSLTAYSPERVSAMSSVTQRFYARVYGYLGSLGRYDLWVRVTGCP